MWRALILMAMILPGPVQAGPWLRAEGEGFVSYSIMLVDAGSSDVSDGYATLYGEYGAAPNLSLGVDLGTDGDGFYSGFVFALLPLSRERIKVALELGAGVIDGAGAMRPGLSLGTGFTAMGRPGWASLDARSEIMARNGNAALSADLTLGIKPRPGTKVILQLQQGGPMHDPDYLRLAPSIVWEMKPGRHLEIGATAGLKNAEDYGIKLGFWHSF